MRAASERPRPGGASAVDHGRLAPMRPSRVELIAAAVLCVGAACLPVAQRHAVAWSPRVGAQDEISLMPSGKMVKAASLGYREVVADLLWVRATLMFGGRYGEADHSWYPWLFHLIDLATELDPPFRAAYKYGGTMLRADGVFVEQSNLIFQKGMHALPQEWSFPFAIAMNYFMYNDDAVNAARYMERAAVLPGAPFYLRNLAATLRSDSDGLDAALAFTRQELENVVEPRVRTALEVKLVELEYLVAERDASAQIAAWRRANGGLPVEPSAVAAGGFALPPDPLGGRWIWSLDPADEPGEVQSSRYCAVFSEQARTTGLGRARLDGCPP